MQLIGQFDSPFVRRVGIALTWYGIPFTHLPLSVFADAEALATYNPLRRVPTLVTDGVALTETFVCLDAIDQFAAQQHGRGVHELLVPASGAQRRAVLRRCGLASGAADKVVSLVYEEKVREQRSARWTARCSQQVTDTLGVLEQELATGVADPRLTHADIAITCLMTFITQAQPWLLSLVYTPTLCELQQSCERRPEFKAVFAPFTVAPAP